ncbi:hypothetical protein [Hymenobacter fodinae]|uniref:Uncharacterized protein n=1 Tax=Hymenobacter fodinae TaxID=2510796 RepID=A0A4Z0P585_9BACT|nr:hypothetical protein [Hymenobacter fodinae]TGE05537.1 hypothetical protein EU556_19750 [Hymenobacter fodinae]
MFCNTKENPASLWVGDNYFAIWQEDGGIRAEIPNQGGTWWHQAKQPHRNLEEVLDSMFPGWPVAFNVAVRGAQFCEPYI